MKQTRNWTTSERKGDLNLDLNVKVSRPYDQGLLRLNVF